MGQCLSSTINSTSVAGFRLPFIELKYISGGGCLDAVDTLPYDVMEIWPQSVEPAKAWAWPLHDQGSNAVLIDSCREALEAAEAKEPLAKQKGSNEKEVEGKALEQPAAARRLPNPPAFQEPPPAYQKDETGPEPAAAIPKPFPDTEMPSQPEPRQLVETCPKAAANPKPLHDTEMPSQPEPCQLVETCPKAATNPKPFHDTEMPPNQEPQPQDVAETSSASEPSRDTAPQQPPTGPPIANVVPDLHAPQTSATSNGTLHTEDSKGLPSVEGSKPTPTQEDAPETPPHKVRKLEPAGEVVHVDESPDLLDCKAGRGEICMCFFGGSLFIIRL